MIDSSLCYLYRGDEVLMMHRTRKKNDMNHDKWIAVGGRFEAGETPEECALREVREETGLTMRDAAYRGVVTFINDQYETERMHLAAEGGNEQPAHVGGRPHFPPPAGRRRSVL